MPMQTPFSEKELACFERSELSRRFIQNAIESVLSLGDFQKEIDSCCTPLHFLEEVAERIRNLIVFDAAAIYLVDEKTSDIHVGTCWPSDAEKTTETEMAFLIDNGYVAWALREHRGIRVFSKDGSHQILLHVLATYARIRGLFIGIFPVHQRRLPDAAQEILSVILRNTANALESLTCSGILRHQMKNLESIVQKKTEQLVLYERQLTQAQKSESIAALAGGIAHQFNNALTSLLGNLDLLEMNAAQNPDVLHYVGRLRPISERMANLTHQLLAYAQGGKYKKNKVSVKKLIEDVSAAFRRSVQASVHLSISLPAKEQTVEVEVPQMQMALLAIVNNAGEAAQDEGLVQVAADRVIVDAAVAEPGCDLKPGTYACISIADTGKGMDAETMRRIFEPFFSTKSVGRGLGMAAVFGIVKNHNGWIHVASSVGKGTRVRVFLPEVQSGAMASGATPR